MLKIGLITGFACALIALGTVDAFITVDKAFYTQLLEKQIPLVAQQDPKIEDQPKEKENPKKDPTSNIDVPVHPKPTPSGGVKPQSGPKIEKILGASGLEFQAINEPIFLSKIIPSEESSVTGTVLLKNKDRIGSISWVESPKIKLYFIALKEALHSAFTPAVSDLVDETQRREGKPPRNLLTFLDTGINEERIVFVRVRDRLFEIHIAKGHKNELFLLIDQLTE